MTIRRDRTDLKELTSGTPNAGFPSFSPDGKEIVYRSWDRRRWPVHHEPREPPGPCTYYSPRQFSGQDGAEAPDDFPGQRCSCGVEPHGKHIMWDDGEYGFKDKAAPYDNPVQSYGFNGIMNPDGTGKRQLADSHWEDSMPCLVPPPCKR